MVISTRPFLVTKVIPISRAKVSEPRPVAEVQADLRAENDRHSTAVERLLSELANLPLGTAAACRGGPTHELRQAKKQAARTLGISEKRLDRLIARFHRDHPDQPKLAVQPDGNKFGRWIVNTERVRVVLYNERPD